MLTYIIKSLQDYETFFVHSAFNDCLVIYSFSPDEVVDLIKLINIQLSTINLLDYKNQIIYYSYTKLLSDEIHYVYYGYIYHVILDKILPMIKLTIFNMIKSFKLYKDHHHHHDDFKCVFHKAWFVIRDTMYNIYNPLDTNVALNDCVKNDENKSLKNIFFIYKCN